VQSLLPYCLCLARLSLSVKVTIEMTSGRARSHGFTEGSLMLARQPKASLQGLWWGGEVNEGVGL
jgi:hypothetical protein